MLVRSICMLYEPSNSLVPKKRVFRVNAKKPLKANCKITTFKESMSEIEKKIQFKMLPSFPFVKS